MQHCTNCTQPLFGIYFHIPFCKSKCGYCDFYSVAASQGVVQQTVDAMLCEVELRKNYFTHVKNLGENATLYFGGGTPSLLHPSQIDALAQKAIHAFGVKNVLEFTVEVNPDDVTPEYLRALREIGVDRLSIGVQSFFDDDLQRVNRRHTAQQAKSSVLFAQKEGFKNISVDLIYGLPQMTFERWKANLETVFSLDVQHLSTYALSVEKGTPLDAEQRRGELVLPTEDEMMMQILLLDGLSTHHGFTHYEISNFGREGFFALHNTAYWQQKPYIGIGAAAHSYCGAQRRGNIANNTLYMERVCSGADFFEVENLTQEQQYNEYVFTGLRTMWGINFNHMKQVFDNRLYEHCLKNAQKHIDRKFVMLKNGVLTIPKNHWLIADRIIMDLIWV